MYGRYKGPLFCKDSQFIACPNPGEESTELVMSRPRHKLKMWLGSLPPSEVSTTPPSYPANLGVPKEYFIRQFISVSGSPLVYFYEMHGDWCIRHIRQECAHSVRLSLQGQWFDTEGFTQIEDYIFNKAWGNSEDAAPSKQMPLL